VLEQPFEHSNAVHEHTAKLIPTQKPIALTRRELLKGTGILTGTLVASCVFATLAPSQSWALEMKGFDTHQGQVLLSFVKRIYPHKTLDDAVYALVVKELDKKAIADKSLQEMLINGVRLLDARGGGDWSKVTINDQDRHTADLAGTAFFEAVRSTAVVALYNNPLAFAHFGYGGAAGNMGYLDKGFSNLTWLADPPAQASGPIPSSKP
jgi:hypothetical protein